MSKKIQGLLLTLILTGISFITLVILEGYVFKGIDNVNFPDFNYKWIYSLIFGFIVGLSIIKNEELDSQGLFFILIVVVSGFVINTYLLLKSLDYQISPIVTTEITLNYKAVFYLPVYPFILLLSIRLLKKYKMKDKIPQLIKIQKPKIARLLAYIVDWGIVIVIGLILYESRVILWFPIEILIVGFAYRFILENVFSMTIGKALFGLIIIKTASNKLTMKDILIRNFMRVTVVYWIPIIFNKAALHDRLSKTRIE